MLWSRRVPLKTKPAKTWLHSGLGTASLLRRDYLLKALWEFSSVKKTCLPYKIILDGTASKSLHQKLFCKHSSTSAFSNFTSQSFLQENANKPNCFLMVAKSFQLGNDVATTQCLVVRISSVMVFFFQHWLLITYSWKFMNLSFWGKSNPITIKPTLAVMKRSRTSCKQKHEQSQPPEVITDTCSLANFTHN